MRESSFSSVNLIPMHVQDTCIEASASGAAKEALDRIDALHAQMAFPNPSNLTEPFTNPASVAAQAESGSDDSTPLPGVPMHAPHALINIEVVTR